MDAGTRGCPIKEGVVLAGSLRKKATHFVIMELSYKGKPAEFRLPYGKNVNVHSIGMVYDRESELLTVAGGVSYDKEKNISNSITQVWQVKLYEQGSIWHRLSDLPYKVFDPVLISHRGNLYVLGGYENPEDRTEVANATRRCVQLVMNGGAGQWSNMGSTVSPASEGLLVRPLDHDFGGRGVLLADNIIMFAKDHVQKYNIPSNSWQISDLKKDQILECTPVIDHHKNRIIVSRRHKVGTKEEQEQDIAKYTSASKTMGYKWKSKLKCGVTTADFHIEHGPGRFLSMELEGPKPIEFS